MATYLSIWTYLAFLLLFCHFGACELVAESNFSQNVVVTELQWGRRSATANCELQFPYITVESGSAFVLTRFNVQVLDFVHYLAYLPGSVTMGPTSQWLIARSDYTYTSYFTYSFLVTYEEYLGAGAPTGDCTLFTNFTEAQDYAATLTDLLITEADRLVSTSTFSHTSVQTNGPSWNEVLAVCQPSFNGIKLGLYEIYTYVNFNMPVTNVTSNYMTEFVAQDSKSQWYFGRYPNHAIDYLDEAYVFYVPEGTSTNYQLGNCSVYAVTNKTLPDIVGKLDLTSSSTSATVVTQTTDSSLLETSTVSGLNVTVMENVTTILNVTLALPTFEIVENFTHSQQRRYMTEYSSMRDWIVFGNPEMWTLSETNILTCGRKCLKDINCSSVFFSETNRTCYGHSDVYASGDTELNSTMYYVIV